MGKRKFPLQKRSKEKVENILEAARSIIINEGVLNFNTNNIAKKAGISIGCIYQYFNSKEGILLALIKKDFSTRVSSLENNFQKFKNYPFEEKVKETINILFDFNDGGRDLITAGKYLQLAQVKSFQIDFQREVTEKAKSFLTASGSHIPVKKIENTLFVFFQSMNSDTLKEQRENVKSALFNLSLSYLQI